MTATVPTARALPRIMVKSSSMPTRSVKMIRATCPTTPSTDRACGGNTQPVMLGIAPVISREDSQCRNSGGLPQEKMFGPSKVGPSMRPAKISPTTLG